MAAVNYETDISSDDDSVSPIPEYNAGDANTSEDEEILEPARKRGRG